MLLKSLCMERWTCTCAASGHTCRLHVLVSAPPRPPWVYVCQREDDKPHWTVGGPNRRSVLYIQIKRVVQRWCWWAPSCLSSPDWGIYQGVSARRHIGSSVRRPSLLVLLHVPAHSGHYHFILLQYEMEISAAGTQYCSIDAPSLIKHHWQCISRLLNTSGMYSGMHVQHLWVLNKFHLSHIDVLWEHQHWGCPSVGGRQQKNNVFIFFITFPPG